MDAGSPNNNGGRKACADGCVDSDVQLGWRDHDRNGCANGQHRVEIEPTRVATRGRRIAVGVTLRQDGARRPGKAHNVASSYLHPGVYVEEVASGSATLSASDCDCGLRRFHREGPIDDPTDPMGLKPRLVTSWSQFEDLYGGLIPGAMLPHSVYGWFNNGGGVCYIALRTLSPLASLR